MANSKPIIRKRWQRRLPFRKIPASAIRKETEWLPLGTGCTPQSFATPTDTCSAGPVTGLQAVVEIIAPAEPGLAADIINIHGIDVHFQVLYVSDPNTYDNGCEVIQDEALSSLHLRWALYRYDDKTFKGTQAVNPFTAGATLLRDAKVLEFGDSVIMPRPSFRTLVNEPLSDCESTGTSNIYQMGYDNGTLFSFRVRHKFRLPMQMKGDNGCVVAIALKSFFTGDFYGFKYTAFGRALIS